MAKEKTDKQIQAEKDGWHQMKPKSPCDGCEMGYGSYSHSVIDGVDYSKSESCHDTCVRFKNWKPEPARRGGHLFGDNIRDAIKTIRGR